MRSFSGQTCSDVLKVLGEGTRLKILQLLDERARCVSDLMRELNRPQPHVSHHLKVLKRAGLVQSYRVGHKIGYALSHQVAGRGKSDGGGVWDLGCCQVKFRSA